MKQSTMDSDRLVRKRVLSMQGYVPVLPPETLAEHAGIPANRIIKLNGNENPYGCSPRVQEALGRYGEYHIYPDPDQSKLRALLESYTGIGREHIIAGAGSDEVMDILMRVFLEPGDNLINCTPTFGMYSFLANVCGADEVEVRRTPNFAVDVPAVLKAVDARTKLIFIASPNNPTGNLTPLRDVEAILDTGKIVVVDEAYFEFSKETVASLVEKYDNLVVLRTLSKWAGLAGLRLGYGIVPTKIALHMWKIKQPYNVTSAAEIAACESLADLDYLKNTIDAILSERENLFDGLAGLDFLKPLPTQANFIYCEVLRGHAKAIVDSLQDDGIFIRFFDTPLLKNSLRISVGKPEHTQAVISSLRNIGEKLESI